MAQNNISLSDKALYDLKSELYTKQHAEINALIKIIDKTNVLFWQNIRNTKKYSVEEELFVDMTIAAIVNLIKVTNLIYFISKEKPSKEVSAAIKYIFGYFKIEYKYFAYNKNFSEDTCCISEIEKKYKKRRKK